MFQEFNIAPVGNSSGGITLQQQCSGSLEGLSYTEGFQSREEWHSHVSIISHLHWQGNNRNFNLIPWALHRQNLYCNLEPFPYGLRVKLQSQTRTIRMWNTPVLWGKPCTTSCLLVLMGSWGYINRQWTWGIQWHRAHLPQERMKVVFCLTRWFLSKYLCYIMQKSNVFIRVQLLKFMKSVFSLEFVL